MNTTLRNNITLNLRAEASKDGTSTSSFNAPVYDSVIHACDLREDIASFDYGDMTVIGERGVTLSGGQKQRLALARAAYHALAKPGSIVILDDPLSALDAQTSKRVWERLLSTSGLLHRANVTRILVTHDRSFLPSADTIFAIHTTKFAKEADDEQNQR